MSLHEEDAIVPSSDSFWEIGQYKRTVKRIDDALQLCGSLSNLVKERGEIEANYAKSLKTWSQKWAQQIERAPEYGSTQEAWKAVLEEAEERCKLHNRVKERLTEEVINTIKIWSKENYHMKALGGLKECKEIEEEFRKSQKPWAKLYTKAEKAKKEYHQARKSEKSAGVQVQNSKGDTSLTPDATRKLEDRLAKCKEDSERTKHAYEKAINEMSAYNAKYMEDMTMVFEKCQEMELKRLKFFKEMLFGVHKCLDLSQDDKLENIYKSYGKRLESADGQQDVRWWAVKYGTGAPYDWPKFEEYSPEMRRIGIKKSPSDDSGSGAASVTLTKSRHTADVSLPTVSGASNGNNGHAGASSLHRGQPHPQPIKIVHNQNVIDLQQNVYVCVSKIRVSSRCRPKTPDGDAYYDDDWDSVAVDTIQPDDGRPGVKVKALYDYAPQEGDELQLCKGDVFEKLEDEDDQGWCKGRKNGKLGLYPANYAQAV